MNLRRTTPWLALAILTGISTVGFIDRIVVNVLVEPVKAEFGLSDSQVSLMGVAFTALNIVVSLMIARVAERVRRMSLISVGTLLWSAATALCGWATGWTNLLVARIGVGVGEGVGLPALQSVLADYYPAHRRGLALSVLMLAPPIGAMVGFIGGAWIAQEFGWRHTFLVAAVPGVVLALLAWVFIAEPKRGQHDAASSNDAVPPVKAVLHRLLAFSSARHLLFGSALAATLGFGLNYFFTSLMMRRFDVGLAEAGFYAGIIASAPAAISVVLQGWLADRLAARTQTAYMLIPAACLLLGGPLYVLAITRDALPLLLVLVSIATFLNFGYLGVTYASLQNLMHPRMRATASALIGSLYGIAGAGGPVLVGLLSDRFTQTQGPAEGLVTAMAIVGALYVWAGLHYGLAARRYTADLADTAARDTSRQA
ncbi:MAG: MFS transporter [Alteraurantiacibacter sp.]